MPLLRSFVMSRVPAHTVKAHSNASDTSMSGSGVRVSRFLYCGPVGGRRMKDLRDIWA